MLIQGSTCKYCGNSLIALEASLKSTGWLCTCKEFWDERIHWGEVTVKVPAALVDKIRMRK